MNASSAESPEIRERTIQPPRRRAEPWWRIAERYDIVSIQTRLGVVADDDQSAGSAYSLPNAAIGAIVEHCEPRAEVQLIIDRGGADAAVRRGLSMLMPDLLDGSARRGLSVGRLIAVHPCRLGVVEAIARVLDPRVVVLITARRRRRGSMADLSAIVAVRPDWDARPACCVRLRDEQSRRRSRRPLLQLSPGAGYPQATRLLLDLAYALTASPDRPSGTLLDAMSQGRDGDRAEWNPDGLPETGR